METARATTHPIMPDLKSHTELITIDGVQHEIEYKEWLTFKNEKASGYSCQVDKLTNLSSKTREGIIEEIINHKPFKINASAWYGKGQYTGD